MGRRYSELLDYIGQHQEMAIDRQSVIAGGDVQAVAPNLNVVDNDFQEGKNGVSGLLALSAHSS